MDLFGDAGHLERQRSQQELRYAVGRAAFHDDDLFHAQGLRFVDDAVGDELHLLGVAGEHSEVDGLEEAEGPVFLRGVEYDGRVDDGVRARKPDEKHVRVLLLHGDEIVSRGKAEALLHLELHVADYRAKPLLEFVDASALLDRGVGEHHELFRRVSVADQEDLRNPQDVRHVDAERAVHHAAPAPGARECRLFHLVHHPFVERRGVAPVREEPPGGPEVFFYRPAHHLGAAHRRVFLFRNAVIGVAGVVTETAARAGVQVVAHRPGQARRYEFFQFP